MLCRVDERVAVGNLERIGNELRVVIGLRKSQVFPNKVFVRCNFSALVDFRVVGWNEQNWYDPQAALSHRASDSARDEGKGQQRKRPDLEAKPNRKEQSLHSEHRVSPINCI